MKPLDRANRYLAIPPALGDVLDGLRWSFPHDGILDSDGNTFALVEELIPVLEGVFAKPPVPSFAYVLAALHAIKRNEAYPKARGSAALARNVGLLIADLCVTMPSALAPPDWADVRLALENRIRFGRPSMPYPGDVSTISLSTIATRIRAILRKFTTEWLVARLTHGAPPLDRAAKELAEPLESLPVRIGKLFALAEARPRLVGAAYLTPALDAALTFPPRRRSPDAVPQGGYADVTTRGQPDRLLLSQFALDSDEFVRRFAENELLYFRPEEPHEPEPPDRVIVLDQGVRTWGHVRLALAGAAMTLLRRQGKAVGPATFIHSAERNPVSLESVSPDELVEMLEASDLSATPADTLATALTLVGTRDRPRDVILLTHPRSLAESAVAYVLNARRETDRIFALTVDATGQAELHEWGKHGPVRLRSFRVDLVAAEKVSIPKAAPRFGTSPMRWTGDVEPFAFPFRPGIVADPVVFGFDGTGDWLVTASREGILQAVATNGDPPEVLPRPFRDGVVLKQVEAILGTMDGVVVCGRMNLPEESHFVTVTSNAVTGREPALISSASDFEPPRRDDWYVAAHYDRSRRTVKLHRFAKVDRTVLWFVSLNRQSMGIRSLLLYVPEQNIAINLYTNERTQQVRNTGMTVQTDGPPYRLPIWLRESHIDGYHNVPYLLLEKTQFEVRRVLDPWPSFQPMREGKPLLDGVQIEAAQFANDILVLGTLKNGEREKLVFRGPEPRLVYRLPRADRGSAFALSPDGSLLAFKSRVLDVSIVETTSSALPRTVAATARLHNGLVASLIDAPFSLTIGVGDFVHSFWIEVGRFRHALRRGKPPVQGRPATSSGPSYDPSRFPQKEIAQTDTLSAVVDRLGQVLLMTANRVLVSFAIRRERVAAIADDGSCWGDIALLGCPATPGVEERLAKVIAMSGGRAR